MSQFTQEYNDTSTDLHRLVKFHTIKNNVSGTILADASMLEYHVMMCLAERSEPFTSVHAIFAWLKGKQVLKPCESKKRLNKALHNLVQWKIVNQTFENKIPMYALPSTKTKQPVPVSPACSPPAKGQSSYLPVGYDVEDLKPHNFQTNHEIESCVKHILDEVKTLLNSGVGRNMQVSHVEFRINLHRLLVPKLSTRRADILQLSLKYALLAMNELGWECHMTKQIQWNSQHVIIPIDTQLILTC